MWSTPSRSLLPQYFPFLRSDGRINRRRGRMHRRRMRTRVPPPTPTQPPPSRPAGVSSATLHHQRDLRLMLGEVLHPVLRTRMHIRGGAERVPPPVTVTHHEQLGAPDADTVVGRAKTGLPLREREQHTAVVGA